MGSSIKTSNPAMSLLFDVPELLLCDILSIWCDEKSLARIDTSLCSKQFRTKFLATVSSEIFSMGGNFHPSNKDNYVCQQEDNDWRDDGDKLVSRMSYNRKHIKSKLFFPWTRLRGIKCKRLELPNTPVDVDISHVVELSLVGYDHNEIFAEIISSCPRLFSLYSDVLPLDITPKIMKQLESICLSQFAEENTAETLQFIGKTCKNLKKFIFNDFMCASDEETNMVTTKDILNILKSNKKIEVLHLTTSFNDFNDDFLTKISKLCGKTLKEFLICNSNNEITMNGYAYILKNCTELIYFGLISNEENDAQQMYFHKRKNKKMIYFESFDCVEGDSQDLTILFSLISDFYSFEFRQICGLTNQILELICMNNPNLYYISFDNVFETNFNAVALRKVLQTVTVLVTNAQSDSPGWKRDDVMFMFQPSATVTDSAADNNTATNGDNKPIRVQKLSLRICLDCDAEMILHIVKNSPYLTHLNVSTSDVTKTMDWDNELALIGRSEVKISAPM